MRIVQLVNRRHWDHKIDRSRFLSIEPLEPLRTGVDWEGYDAQATVEQNLRNLYGDLPDVVIAYKPLDHRGFRELPCPTVLVYNEIKPHRFRPEIANARPSLVVFHHYNEYQAQRQLVREIGARAVYLPHMADPAIFQACRPLAERRWDVMVTGALGGRIYPLRTKFRAACEILLRRGWRCMTLPHPGNELENAASNQHLVNFAAAVNDAKITCFCSSIYRYRLAKYVEVPACGSVVAADMPSDPYTMPHLLDCTPDETPEQLAAILETELLDDDSLARRATLGVRYAAQFTPEAYSRDLQAELANLNPPNSTRRST